MYYFLSDEGRLIETDWGGDPERYAQELADECQCNIYVVDGQHTGITASPKTHREDQRLRAAGAPGLPGLE